eukprot:TRINITY_DN22962_c0_g1_i1.p1 TRINITY_DN22962_c0_g1~~TRINITY_DN22962_c0_g1_i1.p1  ORF type:complete len:735 (+),score=238.76 TRINITY_DN22962_c0_g1_i1:84-2288(+)
MNDAGKQGTLKRTPLHSSSRGMPRGGASGASAPQQLVEQKQNKDGLLFISAQGVDRMQHKRVQSGGAGRGSAGTWRRSSVLTGKSPSQPMHQPSSTPTPQPQANARANSAPVLNRRVQSASAGAFGSSGPPQSGRKGTGESESTDGGGPLPKPPDFSPSDRPAANPAPCYLETWTYEEYATSKAAASERVSIHVHDEVSNVSRNFICKRDVLLREMKYFNSYLSNDCCLDDLDISVHCDVSIFRWLMEYVHNDPEHRPKPDPTVAVSILISSDFLQMQGLVTESLHYVMKHFQEIVKLPIDLDCINKGLIARLAALFSFEDLDKIRDRKDKMVGALFLQKLKELLVTTGADGEPHNVLYRCALCSRLFTLKQQRWSVCHESMPIITFNGESVSEHVIDPHWDVSMYLAQLRAKRLSWKEIYWRLWSLINDDVCMVCSRHFTIAEIAHCSYHEYLPRFEANSAVGVFPCCGVEVKRFEGGTVRQSGCKSRYHIPSDAAQKDAVMDIVSRHSYILIPKEEEANELSNSLTSHLLGAGEDPESDDDGSDEDDTFGPDWRRRSKWSVASLVGGSAGGDESGGRRAAASSAVSRQERGGKRASSLAGTTSEASRHTPYRLDHTHLSSQAGAHPPRGPTPKPGISATVTKKAAGKGGGKRDKVAVTSGEWFNRLGPKARAAFLVDLQREADQKRMQSLVSFLEKRRGDADKGETRKEPAKAPPKKAVNVKKQTGFGRAAR